MSNQRKLKDVCESIIQWHLKIAWYKKFLKKSGICGAKQVEKGYFSSAAFKRLDSFNLKCPKKSNIEKNQCAVEHEKKPFLGCHSSNKNKYINRQQPHLSKKTF